MIQPQQTYFLDLYRSGMRATSDIVRASLENAQRISALLGWRLCGWAWYLWGVAIAIGLGLATIAASTASSRSSSASTDPADEPDPPSSVPRLGIGRGRR